MSQPESDVPEVERELVARAIAGDEQALGELLGRYTSRLRAFIFRSPRVHASHREDYYQHVCRIVVRRIPHYDPTRLPFGAFLLYTARIEQANFFKSQEFDELDRDPLLRRLEIGDRSKESGDGSVDHSVEVADRRQSVEGRLVGKAEVEDALKRVFSASTSCHHVLVFGLRQFLEQAPRAIVNDWWLARSSALLEAIDEAIVSTLDGFVPLAAVVAPFRSKLEQTLGSITDNRAARETYAVLLDRVAADIRLREYYDAFRERRLRDGARDLSPEEAVSAWIGYVVRALARQGGREGRMETLEAGERHD